MTFLNSMTFQVFHDPYEPCNKRVLVTQLRLKPPMNAGENGPIALPFPVLSSIASYLPREELLDGNLDTK